MVHSICKKYMEREELSVQMVVHVVQRRMEIARTCVISLPHVVLQPLLRAKLIDLPAAVSIKT
jgi:hypothetical protein